MARVVAVVASLLVVVAVVGAVTRRPASEKDIRAVLDEQTKAWNKGDLEGFMTPYWKSDELRFYSGGEVTSGWKATLDRYRKRYQADGKEMGQVTFTEVDVQVLSADSALVRGRWKLTFTKTDDKPHGLFTLIMRKHADGWKIVHDHTSIAEPKKP